MSNEIAAKMVEAAKTSEMIETTSEKYRGVATRGALLFFLLNDLFRVHSYYLYSLNAFVVVFLRGIDACNIGKAYTEERKRKRESVLIYAYIQCSDTHSHRHTVTL